MTLSIVIPFFNEAESAGAVLDEVRARFPEAEIVAVDDGSRDATGQIVAARPDVTLVAFPKNLGQSAAIFAGLTRARGEICVLLDGDGQNDPADIPAVLAALETADLVCGYRRQRQDNWRRRLASRIANAVRRAALGDGIRDTGCSLKAFRREHVGYLIPFNGMHRYLPALLGHAGLRIVEVPVNHRPRLRGVSKYTIGGRAWRGIRDLIGVSWLLSRQICFPREVFTPPPDARPPAPGARPAPAALPSKTP